MRDFYRCATCGKYGWTNEHKCPPRWEVCFDGDGEDEWCEAYGHDAGEAVESWLDENDCHRDYLVISSGSAVMWARKFGDGSEPVRLEIEAEARPHYRAVERPVL